MAQPKPEALVFCLEMMTAAVTTTEPYSSRNQKNTRWSQKVLQVVLRSHFVTEMCGFMLKIFRFIASCLENVSETPETLT